MNTAAAGLASTVARSWLVIKGARRSRPHPGFLLKTWAANKNNNVGRYAGGSVANPTYDQVCGGRTGHAEVVQITYDPQLVSFRDLLDVFFTIHDPTTKDRQGADVGPQYRSIIMYHDAEQKKAAERAIAELREKGVWRAPIVTEVVPHETFYPAEAYHQEYFEQNPRQRSAV